MIAPIQKTLNLDRYNFYETHLSLVNAFLPVKLTPMEIKVLAAFMDINIKEDFLGTTAKKKVREKLELSHGGLSNYMRSFQDKKVIFEEELTKSLFINPILLPNEKEQTYMFRLINKDNNN